MRFTPSADISMRNKAMEFASEAALQVYCLEVLKSKGIAAQAEVWTNGIRADIVTDDSVYELKKVLTREAIYQAFGQASAYNQTLKRRYICIVGQSPNHPAEFEQAVHIAKAISTATVRVSFIDHDSFWNRENVGLSRWLHLSLSSRMRASVKEGLWMLGIGVVGALCVCLAVNYLWANQDASNSIPSEQEQVNDK